MTLKDFLTDVLDSKIELLDQEKVVFEKWKLINQQAAQLAQRHSQLTEELQKTVMAFENCKGRAEALAELLHDMYSERNNLTVPELKDLIEE